MIVDEFLGRDAVDFVHKTLLIREEVVEFVGQPSAEGDAAFVTLIQILHHWEKTGTGLRIFCTSILVFQSHIFISLKR